MQTTLEVLSELGAEDKEILTVFNKIDLWNLKFRKFET